MDIFLSMRNSTIIPKKRQLDCGCFDYAFSKNKCRTHATFDSYQARLEKITEKVIKEDDLSDLIADADAIFSKFIRLKYADKNGMVACYTCGTIKHWTLMQNGHYQKRGNLFLRHDERNCRPQDSYCNENLSGNMPEYTKRLEAENPGITDILKQESVLVHKPTRDEIRQIISEYTPKVKELLKKLKQ